MFSRYFIGAIRPGGGALVGGDDKIWIKIVISYELGRMHDLRTTHIIRQIQQTTHKRHIGVLR